MRTPAREVQAGLVPRTPLTPARPLVLPFQSLTSENGRFLKNGKTGRLFLRPDYRDGKAAIRAAAVAWWGTLPILDAPVCMTARYWFPDRRRRDFSNYVKALKDALIGVVYVDDVLVGDEQWVRVGYDKMNPRAEIIVSLIGQHEQAA